MMDSALAAASTEHESAFYTLDADYPRGVCGAADRLRAFLQGDMRVPSGV